MGQPEFTKSEAQLLKYFQGKKILTGWPKSIANVVGITFNSFKYAKKKLSDYAYIYVENLSIGSKKQSRVIRISITDKGMGVVAISDGKGAEQQNDDIKNLIADMGYTQKEIAEMFGLHRTTFMRKLASNLPDDERMMMIAKLEELRNSLESEVDCGRQTR